MPNSKKQPNNLRFAVIATDTVLFTFHEGKLKVLLISLSEDSPFPGRRGLPGGLIKPGENAETAARRHLKEKAGGRFVHMEQLYTFSEVDRDPRGRVVSTAYLALAPSTKTDYSKGRAEWFNVGALPKLGYDHKHIITTARRRLAAKLEYTNIAYALLPEEFTLGELQQVYEVVLRRDIDKRNFRKKIQALDIVKPLDKKRKGQAHRPAQLWTFQSRTLKTVQIL